MHVRVVGEIPPAALQEFKQFIVVLALNDSLLKQVDDFVGGTHFDPTDVNDEVAIAQVSGEIDEDVANGAQNSSLRVDVVFWFWVAVFIVSARAKAVAEEGVAGRGR